MLEFLYFLILFVLLGCNFLDCFDDRGDEIAIFDRLHPCFYICMDNIWEYSLDLLSDDTDVRCAISDPVKCVSSEWSDFVEWVRYWYYIFFETTIRMIEKCMSIYSVEWWCVILIYIVARIVPVIFCPVKSIVTTKIVKTRCPTRIEIVVAIIDIVCVKKIYTIRAWNRIRIEIESHIILIVEWRCRYSLVPIGTNEWCICHIYASSIGFVVPSCGSPRSIESVIDNLTIDIKFICRSGSPYTKIGTSIWDIIPCFIPVVHITISERSIGIEWDNCLSNRSMRGSEYCLNYRLIWWTLLCTKGRSSTSIESCYHSTRTAGKSVSDDIAKIVTKYSINLACWYRERCKIRPL